MRKLSELEVRELYQTDSTNRFAAWDDLNDNEDINRA